MLSLKIISYELSSSTRFKNLTFFSLMNVPFVKIHTFERFKQALNMALKSGCVIGSAPVRYMHSICSFFVSARASLTASKDIKSLTLLLSGKSI